VSVFSFSDLAFMGAVTVAGGYDPDAQAYITAVETADGQALETGVRDAINAFVVGCKADGIWTAIKASCIMAGARTLSGALVPLVGTAPTNFNFVAGDYNRKTGLVGNGSTKYLNSNRAGNADPQNNFSAAVHISSIHSTLNAGFYLGNGASGTGATNLGRGVSEGAAIQHFARCRSTVNSSLSGATGPNPPASGLFGVSRVASSNYTLRTNQSNFTKTATSETRPSENFLLFCRNNGSNSPEFYSNARLAFYSIGESLNLALLDTRVTALINAFAAAIP
jgi:hypothetical protein